MVDSAGGASAKAPAAPSAGAQGAGAPVANGDGVAELRKLVGELEERNSELQARLPTCLLSPFPLCRSHVHHGLGGRWQAAGLGGLAGSNFPAAV